MVSEFDLKLKISQLISIYFFLYNNDWLDNHIEIVELIKNKIYKNLKKLKLIKYTINVYTEENHLVIIDVNVVKNNLIIMVPDYRCNSEQY